jgi:hypothetical protein
LNNALVILPGSVGAGKSTLLAHLAESEEYKQYAGANNIEILVTFNNLMPNPPEYSVGLGTRMLYSALLSNRSLTHCRETWEAFCAAVQPHSKRFDGATALEVIRAQKSTLPSRRGRSAKGQQRRAGYQGNYPDFGW